MNRYEQARSGLDIKSAGGVVRIRDGQTTWICTSAAYSQARASMEDMPALTGDTHGANAYAELCAAVVAPVATATGDDVGDAEAIRALVNKAVAEGLIDRDEAIAGR